MYRIPEFALQSVQPVANPSFGLRHIVGAPIVSPDDAHDYWPATSNR